MMIENMMNRMMMGIKVILRMMLLMDSLCKSRTARLLPLVDADFFDYDNEYDDDGDEGPLQKRRRAFSEEDIER